MKLGKIVVRTLTHLFSVLLLTGLAWTSLAKAETLPEALNVLIRTIDTNSDYSPATHTIDFNSTEGRRQSCFLRVGPVNAAVRSLLRFGLLSRNDGIIEKIAQIVRLVPTFENYCFSRADGVVEVPGHGEVEAAISRIRELANQTIELTNIPGALEMLGDPVQSTTPPKEPAPSRVVPGRQPSGTTAGTASQH